MCDAILSEKNNDLWCPRHYLQSVCHRRAPSCRCLGLKPKQVVVVEVACRRVTKCSSCRQEWPWQLMGPTRCCLNPQRTCDCGGWRRRAHQTSAGNRLVIDFLLVAFMHVFGWPSGFWYPPTAPDMQYITYGHHYHTPNTHCYLSQTVRAP